jgi:hypothetical protein
MSATVIRRLLAFALVATTGGGVAFADKPVRASATVEVLDDKAQIDDVITRMRDEQQKRKDAEKAQAEKAEKNNGTLRDARPPATLGSSDTHRTPAPEAKSQPPGSRRPLRDEHLERFPRPRAKHK